MATIATNFVQVHPFRWRDRSIQHLVLLRSVNNSFCPGIWQVVTGFVREDERSVEAAKRELREETGLESEVWYALAQPALFYFHALDQVVVSPVFACDLTGAGSEVILSDEHSNMIWASSREAQTLLEFPSHINAMLQINGLLAGTSGSQLMRI